MALQSYTLSVGNLQDDGSGNNYAVNKPVYILKQDRTLQPIYSDFYGSTPIVQDGLNNVTDNRGQFTFFVESGDYMASVGGIDRTFTVVGSDYFNNKVDEAVDLIIDTVSDRGAYYVVGSFESGFTYTDINQTGTYNNSGTLEYYVYTGGLSNLPHAVTAGTNPTNNSDYARVNYNQSSQIFNDDGSTVQDYITSNLEPFKTVAEMKLFNFEFDSVGVEVKTRHYYEGGFGGASYTIKTESQSLSDGDVIDGWGNHILNNGMVAILKNESDTLRKSAQWGCLNNGVSDDSGAWQAMIDSLPYGGDIKHSGKTLIGGLVVTQQNLNISGDSLVSKIIVKDGHTGILFEEHWCGLSHLTIKSQGHKDDGLGTNGVEFRSSPNAGVSGFNYLERINVDGFSGSGVLAPNSIDFKWLKGYVRNCKIGLNLPFEDPIFGTTSFIDDVYFAFCGKGIYANKQYRSQVMNCIFEHCNYGIDWDIGDFTLQRCYFEKNVVSGARVTNAGFQDLWNYQNDPDGVDKFEILFTIGAIPASDRGYSSASKQDWTGKSFTLQSGYGVDPLSIKAIGGKNNKGIKYGENTIALIRGKNLVDESAWESNTLNEFSGWSNNEQGYIISRTLVGTQSYGMLQTINFDNTKTYVIDVDFENVSGSGLDTIEVGGDIITNGVPFKPTVSGDNTVKIFGADTDGVFVKSVVRAFNVAELRQEDSQITQSTHRLTREVVGRGALYMAEAPTTGSWSVGESIELPATLSNPVKTKVCVSSGSPGTWRPTAWVVGMGSSSNRPFLLDDDIGVTYLDTDLSLSGKKITWNGVGWVDESGDSV